MNRAVRQGNVAWTGDNPFIYLKEDPAGDYSTLSVFFRIAASKYGTGRATLVVENPYDADKGHGVVLTDNGPLARYLVDNFVSRFVLFRPCTFMNELEYICDATFEQQLDGNDWVEKASSGNRSIIMTWRDLKEPFAVDVPGPESGTGEHEMFAVFRIARSAEVRVDGRPIPGETVEREFLDGLGQSAGMAISETWVEDK